MALAEKPLHKEFDLQIIICSGPEHIERATLGFSYALAAAAACEVVVFMTMSGAVWTNPNQGLERQVPKFESIDYYMRTLAEMDVRLEGCTSCVENHFPEAFRKENPAPMREGVVLAGLSASAIRAITTVTLTF